MKQADKPPVSAEVLLMSAAGKDPYGATITSENLQEFLPDQQDIEFLKEYFAQQQLQLTYYSGISATLVGSQPQFEILFQVPLAEEGGIYSLKNPEEAADDPTILPKHSLPVTVQVKISVVTLPAKSDTFR
jgi:hypothetical protein